MISGDVCGKFLISSEAPVILKEFKEWFKAFETLLSIFNVVSETKKK
jgi:hypothetical protein